jgi:hypothetical protein
VLLSVRFTTTEPKSTFDLQNPPKKTRGIFLFVGFSKT